MPVKVMIDVRSRAIAFARQQPLSSDSVSALDSLRAIIDEQFKLVKADVEYVDEISNLRNNIYVQLRIGIDNMIANGFEMGYAAAIDDGSPGRALGGVNESSRSRVNRAVKHRR